jgi:hypothetical protein
MLVPTLGNVIGHCYWNDLNDIQCTFRWPCLDVLAHWNTYYYASAWRKSSQSKVEIWPQWQNSQNSRDHRKKPSNSYTKQYTLYRYLTVPWYSVQYVRSTLVLYVLTISKVVHNPRLREDNRLRVKVAYGNSKVTSFWGRKNPKFYPRTQIKKYNLNSFNMDCHECGKLNYVVGWNLRFFLLKKLVTLEFP